VNFEPIATATAGAISGADVFAPSVTSTSFLFDAPRQSLTLKFSESVVGLAADDLQVKNLSSGAVVPASSMSLSYDDFGHIAAISFSGYPQGALPDGNYRVTIAPGAVVTDHAGNALTGGLSYDFFVLGADGNHDRAVDTLDFNALAGNFGQSGRTPSTGDFNYDSVVDTLDFNLLAARFGASLAPPADSALVAAAAATPAASPFAVRAIDSDSPGLPTDAGALPLI
jgi:hypothetical protein